MLAALALLGSCASASSGPSAGRGDTTSAERSIDRVVATVLFADTVVLIGLRPVREHALPPKPVRRAHLSWRLESEAGEMLASGKIPDPRVLVSEFEADGTPNPKNVAAGAAFVEIEIPNVGGTLVLQTPPGADGGVSPGHQNDPRERWTLVIEKHDGVVP